MLRKESAHTDANGHPIATKFEESGGKMYTKAFSLLQNWTEKILDIYKPELRRSSSISSSISLAISIPAIVRSSSKLLKNPSRTSTKTTYTLSNLSMTQSTFNKMRSRSFIETTNTA